MESIGITIIMMKLVIILAYFLRLSTSDCTEEALTVLKKNETDDYYEDFSLEVSFYSVVESIQFTCVGVVLPISLLERKFSCDNCTHQSLHIKNSSLTIIPSEAFSNYSFFTIINMEDQQIEHLAPGAFKYLYSLQNLSLAGNKITEIGTGIFNSLYNLKFLDLSRNKINYLEQFCFVGMFELQFLNMSHNVLKSFDDSYLFMMEKDTTALKILDLSFNNISRFGFSTNNVCLNFHLNYLNLSNNNLRSLKNNICSDTFLNLQDLDLSFNSFNELDSVVSLLSPSINNLRRLDMNHNNISFIPAGMFLTIHKLDNLNLSHNALEQFQYGTFKDMYYLIVLDLSHNKLEELKRYLNPLRNLEELYIDHNKIIHLNSEHLVEDLPHLSKISIADNNLTCENLISMNHVFSKHRLYFADGNTKNTPNVRGISCFESQDS